MYVRKAPAERRVEARLADHQTAVIAARSGHATTFWVRLAHGARADARTTDGLAVRALAEVLNHVDVPAARDGAVTPP